jgi:hypothetical protein
MLGVTFRKRQGKNVPLEEYAEQVDDGLYHQPAISNVSARNVPPVTAGPKWRVVEGPTGRGECLATVVSELELRFLAPPGVPLQLPEMTGALKRWRTALWTCGAVVDGVEVLEPEEAIEMAPTQSAWIEAHEHDRESELLARDGPMDVFEARLASEGDEAASPASFLPDRRRLLSVTKSASTFAALVTGLSPGSAFARIEEVANAASSRNEFDAALGMVGDSLGEDVAHELALALLHARARSHSWRYTWFLGWTERREPLHRMVGREVDRARADRDLAQRLATVELPRRELNQVVVDMLYERSHCLRWWVTAPLREALGTRRLTGPRTVLRERVQPRYERWRAERLPPLSHN